MMILTSLSWKKKKYQDELVLLTIKKEEKLKVIGVTNITDTNINNT